MNSNTDTPAPQQEAHTEEAKPCFIFWTTNVMDAASDHNHSTN